MTAAIAAQQGRDPAVWLQWGGPHRNFVSASTGLAELWRPEGPRRLWSRPLGDGHSSILVDGDRLYTMYRPIDRVAAGQWGEEEVVVALDAAAGKAIWEHRYPAPINGPNFNLNFRFGAGPYATPLVVGDRMFTAGTNTQIFAFDKRTGTVLWSHDLVKEFRAPPTLIRPAVKVGYTCSPIAYKDTIILPAGGPGQAVMAFSQRDGSVVWKSQSFDIAHAAPILITVGGQEQLVVVGGRDVNGLDPNDGRLLWSHRHDTQGDMNISTPVWGEGDLLFVSSAYNGGSRMLHLAREGAETKVKELWFSNRLRVHFGTVIRIGNHVYGSSGDFGPAFFTAIDVRTGDVAWQDRSFGRASFLHADGKLVVLDEEGNLGLVKVSPQGLTVLTKAPVMTRLAWTAPTLVGTKLYLRDRKTIMAVELGR